MKKKEEEILNKIYNNLEQPCLLIEKHISVKNKIYFDKENNSEYYYNKYNKQIYINKQNNIFKQFNKEIKN